MNPIEYKITLDCRRAESQVIITAKQGEASGRKITFSLNEGRLPYKVPSGVTAVLRAKKPSGAVLYNTCTVTADGNVEYIITTQTVAEVGKLPCELQLSQDGKVIFSPNFTLLVYKNLSVDSEVESSDEFTALQAAISRAENLTDGTTFTPTVSEDGVLSWTNDGGKANPDPVNIKGPQGEKGEGGAFRINVTYSGGVFSADKTFDEIKAAYDAGQLPYVVYGGDTIYALSSCYFASEHMFMDFERHLIGEDTLETETLRIYSYTTDSGSNIVKRTSSFDVPSGTTYIAVNSTSDVISTVNGETYADIQALIVAGKPVVVRYEDNLDFYYFETFGFSDSSGIHRRLNFRCDLGSIVYTLTLRDDNTWAFSETSLQSTIDDVIMPLITAQGVRDFHVTGTASQDGYITAVTFKDGYPKSDLDNLITQGAKIRLVVDHDAMSDYFNLSYSVENGYCGFSGMLLVTQDNTVAGQVIVYNGTDFTVYGNNAT